MTDSPEAFDTKMERGSRSASPGSANSKDRAIPASKSKDPSRPKRKKARRACAACQRAHLTCGDERPCERCIKRGLQDDCHDGARKKAKYLRDAPDEALKPGAAHYYSQSNGGARSPTDATGPLSAPINPRESMSQPSNAYADNRRQSMPAGYSSLGGDPRRPSQPQDMTPFNPFAIQPSPHSTQYNNLQESPLQNMSTSFHSQQQQQQQQPLDGLDFTSAFMDPADAALFGLDTSSLNFGNQYGALEFGMLGHMAQAANNPMVRHGSSAYMNPPNELGNYSMNRHGSNAENWHPNDSSINNWASQSMDNYPEGQNTYSIGNVPAGFTGASPASTGTDLMVPCDGMSPDATFHTNGRNQTHQQPDQVRPQDASTKTEQEHRPSKAISKKLGQLPPAATIQQRRRNAAKIYSSVIKPYPYTARFHTLIALIQRRFRSTKRLRIAKALASIRPSFISCTRTLIEEDLILMEKNFQRSLLEYRDHVSACGTPTIICRRTGEVAYCGESFLLLSGWPPGVLSGKEPNLNANRGGDDEVPSGTLTTSSRGGFTTPRIPNSAVEPEPATGPQPVFLTDLLNDDSVIQFYEDFAKIAFADSKGSACRPCKLLKYKTKDDPMFHRSHDSIDGSGGSGSRRSASRKPEKGSGLHEQQDISKLGQDDGTIDCMFCWTVKRDVFEFPMMVVINFLPILQN